MSQLLGSELAQAERKSEAPRGTQHEHYLALRRQHGLEDPVCLVDLGVVARLFRAWTAAMPRVTPFYAVKCNNDPVLLAMLAALGAGFDCASDCEVCARSSVLGNISTPLVYTDWHLL